MRGSAVRSIAAFTLVMLAALPSVASLCARSCVVHDRQHAADRASGVANCDHHVSTEDQRLSHRNAHECGPLGLSDSAIAQAATPLSGAGAASNSSALDWARQPLPSYVRVLTRSAARALSPPGTTLPLRI